MQALPIPSSIEYKDKNTLILVLDELSCVRYVELKYLHTISVSIQFAKSLQENWITANRYKLVAHTLPRKVKTGCLPARYIKILFRKGDLRYLQHVNIYGTALSDLSLLSAEDKSLYIDRPAELIYSTHT